MGFWDDLSNVADYIPGVSNVKGAIEGDWAQAIGGPIAPLASAGADLFSSNIENKGSEQLQELMGQVAGQYEAYRPQQAAARQQAYQQQMSLMGPYNNALRAMYGPGAAYDFSEVFKNPYGEPAAAAPAPPRPQSPMHGPQTSTRAYGSSRSGASMASTGAPYEFVSDVDEPPPPPGGPGAYVDTGPPPTQDFYNYDEPKKNKKGG